MSKQISRKHIGDLHTGLYMSSSIPSSVSTERTKPGM